MPLDITFSLGKETIVVKDKASNEVIIMTATSGGWDEHKPLPKGKWVIAENPRGFRDYFALFYVDSNINDQFFDEKWRDGIRFGYHGDEGSHGCVMTRLYDKDAIGLSFRDVKDKGQMVWDHVQDLIRKKGQKKIITYKNNEIPHKRDDTAYRLTSYGYLRVVD